MNFPDVSKWQGDINFEKMITQTDYIILKCGQGDWIDPKFDRNKTKCLRLGLNFGIYWYYDDRYSPGKQAEKLVEFLGGVQPSEIWCDWENTYNGPYGGLQNVVAFMQRVEELTGMHVGMYTGYYWFVDNSNADTNSSQLNYLKQRGLWLAWYTDDFSIVKVPPPWTEISVWQYGTPPIGVEYGVQSIEIDMNQRLGETPPDPIDPEEPMYRYEMVDIGSNEDRALRSGPNVNFPRVTNTGLPTSIVRDGYVVRGTKMSGDEMITLTEDVVNGNSVVGKVGDQWLKVEQLAEYTANNDYFGYVAYKHMGVVVCDLVTNQVPVPPDPEPTPGTIHVSLEMDLDEEGNASNVLINGKEFSESQS